MGSVFILAGQQLLQALIIFHFRISSSCFMCLLFSGPRVEHTTPVYPAHSRGGEFPTSPSAHAMGMRPGHGELLVSSFTWLGMSSSLSTNTSNLSPLACSQSTHRPLPSHVWHCFNVQDLAFGQVQLHETDNIPLPQPVPVPLDAVPTLQTTNSIT